MVAGTRHTQACGDEDFIRHSAGKNMINGNAKQGLIDYTTIIALPDPLSSRGKKCFIPNGFQHEDTELPMSRQSQPNLESWELKELLKAC